MFNIIYKKMKKIIRIKDCFIPDKIKEYIYFHIHYENFLIIGSSGVGKTVLLESMSTETDSEIFQLKPQELNVQWIRSQLIPLLKSQSSRSRLLVIDELDLILESSQHLIASIIENTDTRLFASCCDPHKIIPALRNQVIHMRLPLLYGKQLNEAINTLYYRHFDIYPSREVREKVYKYCNYNLTRLKMTLYILEDYPIEKHHSIELQNEDYHQSMIDRIYSDFKYYEEYYTDKQVDELSDIVYKIQVYFEKQYE